ncbi:endo-1,4-beta-xylanase [Kiritimatiellaeota bacterium B1221]|nr:endo-1,4-beta-xylanase [Kiritimatiellaeota bacterium B1221]
MKIRFRTLNYLTMFIFSFVCVAAPLPEGGVSVIPDSHFSLSGVFSAGSFEGRPIAEADVQEVDHPEFDQAMQVRVVNPGANYYSSAINIYTTGDVEEGDTILVQLYMRSIENSDESGVSRATAFVQGPGPKYKKYLIRDISAGSEWKLYQLPFKVTDASPAGKLSLHIGAGGAFRPHIWEVGGVQMLNFGGEMALEDLPETRATYVGQEPDAAWRAEADARIEKFRKGDFQIEVVDAAGAPVPHAEVRVEFKRHAYQFGTVISAFFLLMENSNGELYRQKLLELFNQSSSENDLKWGPWEVNEPGGYFDQEQTLAAYAWLKEHNLYTRGHVLVWPGLWNLPERVKPLITQKDPSAKQVILDHIKDITTKTAEYVDEWDVINEPYAHHDVMDAFGDEVMADWFKEARKHLPTQGLFLNDYGILGSQGNDVPHQQHFAKTIRFLKDQGAPVTGMGWQGHFGESPTSIPKVYEVLEYFHSEFPDLDIRVTEFDINTRDYELQADYTRDFLTMLFSHPATVGVQTWGYWEGKHWRPHAAMFTRDWQEKPNGKVWRELTREVWWNDFSGQTDPQGKFSERGFYGNYEVTVSVNGKEQTQAFELLKGKDGLQTVKVVLEP